MIVVVEKKTPMKVYIHIGNQSTSISMITVFLYIIDREKGFQWNTGLHALEGDCCMRTGIYKDG